MACCENEGNDNGCCCCCGSYVGVITMGILWTIGWALAIVNLLVSDPAANLPPEMSDEDKQMAVDANYFFQFIVIGLDTLQIIPFIIVLIW